MYRACRRVSQLEDQFHRAPADYREKRIRMELTDRLLTKLQEVGRSVEDFVLRFDTKEMEYEVRYGWERFTEYSLYAIPVEEAKEALGRV